MNKFQNKLLLVTLILSLSMCSIQFYLIKQKEETDAINQRQRLEIIVLKNALKEQQVIHASLNETNRELVGQNNFLKSQNKMLLDREVTE